MPEYWASFIQTASKINVATFKVIGISEGNKYVLTVMDIVPQHGRIRILAGSKIVANIKDIHLALARSIRTVR